MSTLELDKKDEGINEMVSPWEDGAEYILDRVRVKQTKSDPSKVIFEVIGVEGGEPAEPADPDAEYPEKPNGKASGKMGKPAIMIAFGHR